MATLERLPHTLWQNEAKATAIVNQLNADSLDEGALGWKFNLVRVGAFFAIECFDEDGLPLGRL